jgi:hypothetical protein
MPNEPRKAPSSSDGFIQRINYGQVARLLFIQLRRPRRGLERLKRAAEKSINKMNVIQRRELRLLIQSLLDRRLTSAK